MKFAAGNAQRQTVLLEARDRQAQQSVRAADASQQRVDSLEAQLADLKVKKTERGLVLTLGDVLFDTNQSTLKAGAYGTLDRPRPRRYAKLRTQGDHRRSYRQRGLGCNQSGVV
jgi:outer membrane protein OmpA-like peptidoglycan-associated protein